jgi:hypothetical protein
MDLEKIFELLFYTIPAIVSGAVAYYFFLAHTKNEERKLQLTLLKENKSASLPIKLQAYERMTLFLERINPVKLLVRISSVNDNKEAYVNSILNTIDQEFEHNLTQQIYMSAKCWNVIIASKNATIQLLKMVAEDNSITTAQHYREAVLKRLVNTSIPSETAIAFIKNEVMEII